MTRLAIISDVHGDLHALQDALVPIERLGCDLIVCAGDVLDYGLFPEETIALLRELKIPTIRGNHDRWAVGRRQTDGEIFDASRWNLSPEALLWLANSPTRFDITIDGVRVAVRHASPKGDMDGLIHEDMVTAPGDRQLEQAQADVLIVGHTHVAFAAQTPNGGLVCNPGALLRDGGNQADGVLRPGTFGVLELPDRRWTVYRAADGVEVDIPRSLVVMTDRARSRS